MATGDIGERMSSLVRFLTIDQWKKIDDVYKRENSFDLKAIWVLLTCVAVLILSKYFGTSRFIKGWEPAMDLFAGLPYSDMYPSLYFAVFKGVNYFVLPALVIKLIFKEGLATHGVRLETDRRVLLLYLVMFLAVFPLVYAASLSSAFVEKYPLYHNAGDSLVQLVLWELFYGGQFFMLEFFFRGFLLFTLARYIGAYAIFVMVVPYAMIHFTKPLAETIGAVVTGTALGTLALRTRSIFGGVIIHMTVAWSMDLLALYQKGVFERLL